jgi:hypothetical protein
MPFSCKSPRQGGCPRQVAGSQQMRDGDQNAQTHPPTLIRERFERIAQAQSGMIEVAFLSDEAGCVGTEAPQPYPILQEIA